MLAVAVTPVTQLFPAIGDNELVKEQLLRAKQSLEAEPIAAPAASDADGAAAQHSAAGGAANGRASSARRRRTTTTRATKTGSPSSTSSPAANALAAKAT